jgi:hypothetical protein
MGAGTQAVVQQAPLPPFVCGQTGPCRNAPLHPSALPPSHATGWCRTQGWHVNRGALKGSRAPPTSHVSTTPHHPLCKTPVHPTFHVPCVRCPACRAVCARWHVKGGVCRGLAHGTSSGLCSHPFPLSCGHFPTQSRATGLWGDNKKGDVCTPF